MSNTTEFELSPLKHKANKRSLTLLLVLMIVIFSVTMQVWPVKNVYAQHLVSCDGPAFFITSVTPSDATLFPGSTGFETVNIQLNDRCFDGTVTLQSSSGVTCNNLPLSTHVSESSPPYTVPPLQASCLAPNSVGDYPFTILVNATTPIGFGSDRAPCDSPDILLPSGECEELQTTKPITFHVLNNSLDAIPVTAVIAAVASMVTILVVFNRYHVSRLPS